MKFANEDLDTFRELGRKCCFFSSKFPAFRPSSWNRAQVLICGRHSTKGQTLESNVTNRCVSLGGMKFANRNLSTLPGTRKKMVFFFKIPRFSPQVSGKVLKLAFANFILPRGIYPLEYQPRPPNGHLAIFPGSRKKFSFCSNNTYLSLGIPEQLATLAL